jgi:hypothetical protein
MFVKLRRVARRFDAHLTATNISTSHSSNFRRDLALERVLGMAVATVGESLH